MMKPTNVATVFLTIMKRLQASAISFVVLAVLTVSATPQQAPDPLVKPSTRLAPGYRVSLNVVVADIDEDELCGFYTLDEKGRISLTVGGEVVALPSFTGLKTVEAEKAIKNAVKRYFAHEPMVRLVIVKIPRIQVVIEGATFRNGILTLATGSHLSDALAEAGYMPSADLERVQITRIEKNGNRTKLTANFKKALLEAGSDQFADPVLQTADRITLFLSLEPQPKRTVGVFGEVRKPGFYDYTLGMTIRDALNVALGMLPSADAESVTIVRIKDHSVSVVSGGNAMKGFATDNLELFPDDTVTVGLKDTGQRFAVMGSVVLPGSFDYKTGITVRQAIVMAGGFKPDAERKSVMLLRGMLKDPSHAQPVTVNFDSIAAGNADDFEMNVGDVLQVPQRRKQRFPLLDLGSLLLRLFVL